MCCIDAFEKSDHFNKFEKYEASEQSFISIAKGVLQATHNDSTAFLSAAIPYAGQYEKGHS